MKSLGISCALSTNQLYRREMTQSPLPPKARANFGYQQSWLYKTIFYPRFPPLTPVSLLAASNVIKGSRHAALLEIPFLMLGMCKNTH